MLPPLLRVWGPARPGLLPWSQVERYSVCPVTGQPVCMALIVNELVSHVLCYTPCNCYTGVAPGQQVQQCPSLSSKQSGPHELLLLVSP